MILSGLYFHSDAEAQGWLDYEANDLDIEQAAFDEPDRFAEWCWWRSKWE